MKEKLIIQGRKELKGKVEVNGSKNSAGAILAATLLTDEECIVDNLPKVSDILNLLEIIKESGKEIKWLSERKVSIKSNGLSADKIDFEKISKSRVSVLLMGAFLARLEEFKFSRPGGDRIGLRPIDTHLNVFRELGAEIEESGDYYFLKSNKLKGKEIVLPEFSVTATENLLMAASLSEGTTIIKGAAQEPHVQDLIEMLNEMGAEIRKTWGNILEVKGVKKMKGVEHRIIPDTNEAGTFLIIGAAVGKNVLVNGLIPEHLDLFLAKLKEMGLNFEKKKESVEISKAENLKPVKVQALPYPGFPTDLLPLIIPLLTQAEGRSLIHDPLYENRLNYVHQLRKMGAEIEIVDPHRAFIFGRTPLKGVTIESWDIRAGASLIVAALLAKGESTIKNIEQIDRGYENIEKRLQNIGADIKRINF